jgi:hypothetical protein
MKMISPANLEYLSRTAQLTLVNLATTLLPDTGFRCIRAFQGKAGFCPCALGLIMNRWEAI